MIQFVKMFRRCAYDFTGMAPGGGSDKKFSLEKCGLG